MKHSIAFRNVISEDFLFRFSFNNLDAPSACTVR